MQASRCRRSTDNIREGLPPNLHHQRSSMSGRRGQKRQQPPRVACSRVSSANRRKSTTPGRKPSDAPKTPQTQQHSSTSGAGQATGARKVAEPPKGNLRQDTPRKTAGAAGRGTEATPEEAQQKPTPRRAGGEKEDTAPPPQKDPHAHRGTTRDGGP